MSAFDDEKYSVAYPVSFLMRDVIPESWFRIHSLPKAKRYPDNETEWNVLLRRHRELAELVLKANSPCRVHYSLFDNYSSPEELKPSLNWSEPRETPFSEDEVVFTQTAETNWNFETFLPWIKLRSEDDFGWISFHSLVTDAIYSPYDGGADIFSLDTTFIAKVRSSFTKWKSPHHKGL